MTTRAIKTKPNLFERVTTILEEARNQVVRTVNTRMVVAYWLIGQEIFNAEQGGKHRAGYGETLIKDLSARLTERFGKGYSLANLKSLRQFYLCFKDRLPQIGYTLCSQFTSSQMPLKTTHAKIRQTLSSQLPAKKPANLNNKEIHYTANAGLQPVGEQGSLFMEFLIRCDLCVLFNVPSNLSIFKLLETLNVSGAVREPSGTGVKKVVPVKRGNKKGNMTFTSHDGKQYDRYPLRSSAPFAVNLDFKP